MADVQLLQLARRQFGAVHRRQLMDDLGFTRAGIAGLRQRKEVVEILPSTYRLVSHPDTFLLRAVATQLWADSIGFLSSWSAARIYGLGRMPDDVIHFTVPTGFSRRTPRWIHLDRTAWYDPRRDREQLSTGLIVATPERMLFGLAADVNQHRFDRAVDEAWHRDLVTPQRLADYLERHRCRCKDGVTKLEHWLRDHHRRPRSATIHSPPHAVSPAPPPGAAESSPTQPRDPSAVWFSVRS